MYTMGRTVYFDLIQKSGKKYFLPAGQLPSANFYFTVVSEPFAKRQHTTSSLGQFLFYRRVRTVTRLKAEAILSTIIIGGSS